MVKEYTFTPSQLKAFLQDFACISPDALSVQVTWFHYPMGKHVLNRIITYKTLAQIRPDGLLQAKNTDVEKGFLFTKQFGYYRKTGFNPYGVCAKIINAPEVNVTISPHFNEYKHKRCIDINIDYFDYKG